MLETDDVRTGTVVSTVVTLLLTAGGSAFAQQRPVDLLRSARVQGVIITPQTRLKMNTIQRSLIGLPGAAGRAGQKAHEEFGIPDPALRLRERFLAGLGPDHVADVQLIPDIQGDDAPETLQKAFGNGFVMDFRTRIWRVMFSKGQKHHKIEYWGRARLVRLAEPKVVWNETCKFLGEQGEGTEEDMLANEAALLKSALDLVVDHCVTELSAKFGGG